jgi:hypothetical protein
MQIEKSVDSFPLIRISNIRNNHSLLLDWSLQPNRETPRIKGVKQSYHVNDVLNVNCTTNAHDAQLKWYIINVEVRNNIM